MDSVVHFEITADDPQRAQKFYKGLFGWHIQEAPGIPYWMLTTTEIDKKNMPKRPGAINGGLMQRKGKEDPEGASPVIVINVGNIEEKIGQVEKSGGKIVFKPRKVMDKGLYARVRDTEGNIIGLWQDIRKAEA